MKEFHVGILRVLELWFISLRIYVGLSLGSVPTFSFASGI